MGSYRVPSPTPAACSCYRGKERQFCFPLIKIKENKIKFSRWYVHPAPCQPLRPVPSPTKRLICVLAPTVGHGEFFPQNICGFGEVVDSINRVPFVWRFPCSLSRSGALAGPGNAELCSWGLSLLPPGTWWHQGSCCAGVAVATGQGAGRGLVAAGYEHWLFSVCMTLGRSLTSWVAQWCPLTGLL